MAAIAVRSRPEPSDRRCPWCHEGEAEDAAWVVCQHDQTPIHAACLQEYGCCPICRDPQLGAPQGQAEPATSDRPLAPALDEEHQAFARTIRQRYASRFNKTFDILAFLAAALCAYVLWSESVIIALFVFFGAFGPFGWLKTRLAAARPEAWLDDAADEEQRELARQLAEGDAAALHQSDRFERARGVVREVNRDLMRCEDRLREARLTAERGQKDRRRLELRQRTTLEEARRIHGIGPGVVDALHAADIRNLAELSRAGSLLSLPGIDPRQARLLRSWGQLRELAVERLLDAQPDPQVPEDPDFARRRAELLERKQSAANEAEAAVKILDRWRDQRATLIARLEELQSKS